MEETLQQILTNSHVFHFGWLYGGEGSSLAECLCAAAQNWRAPHCSIHSICAYCWHHYNAHVLFYILSDHAPFEKVCYMFISHACPEGMTIIILPMGKLSIRAFLKTALYNHHTGWIMILPTRLDHGSTMGLCDGIAQFVPEKTAEITIMLVDIKITVKI